MYHELLSMPVESGFFIPVTFKRQSMKIQHLFVAAIAASVLSGCASIKVDQPVATQFERSHTYSLPFEKAWSRSVDWFADHNVAIEKIEKQSGFINAKYLITADESFLNCGKMEIRGVLNRGQSVERFGTLNVTVRTVSDGESKVNVNFFGEYKIRALDAWDGHPVETSGRCVSTGILEKNIFAYITQK